jgi:hypothetical protein
VRPARTIDWSFPEATFGAVLSGRSETPDVADAMDGGARDSQASYDLSDETMCESWLENHYYRGTNLET